MSSRRSEHHSFYYPFIWNVFCLIWLVVGGLVMAFEQEHAIFKWVHQWINYIPASWVIFITHMGTFYFVMFLIILFFIIHKQLFSERKFLLKVLLASQLIPLVLIQSMKALVNAPRPSTVYGEEEWFLKVPEMWGHTQSYWLSFPSGHTAGIAGAFAFLVLMAPATQKKTWTFLGIILIILVALSRMYLSQHFYLDVWAGALVAMFSGYLIYFIFRAPYTEDVNKKHL